MVESVMARIPFNPDNPPEEPPRGAHPLIWRLAWQVRSDHVPDADGFCLARSCRTCWAHWPCHPRRLAEAGLAAAAGDHAKWISLNRGGHFR